VPASSFEVRWTPQALRMLEAVSDQRIREKIFERAKKLIDEPEKQGKPLLGELASLRSLRAVGQRYRVLYRVERNRVILLIVAVGIRKEESREDVYALAKKLFRARLVE